MTVKPLTFITLFLFSFPLTANEIDIQSLGKLQLNYSEIRKSVNVPANKLVARVAVKNGEAFVMTSPTNIHQIQFLVSNGEQLEKGQAVAILRGPEVHHFVTEFRAIKSLYLLSERRMKKNKKLFEKKLIEEEKWLTINKNYFSNLLEYEHMLHFYELISAIDGNTDSITVISPVSGLIKRDESVFRFTEGDAIATFVPLDKIRLKLQVATNNLEHLNSVRFNDCQLNIENVSRVAQAAFVSVWTESVKPSCHVFLGQTLLVTPLYQINAYQINQQAIFRLDGKDQILIQNNEQLETVIVSLITRENNQYFFTSEVDLTNKKVLISSVSAVQGILLGLGGE
ncbi:MAG: hypothetical protein Q9M92_03815 [Enterobacterales bacterium]|nr:hypothetical protein [Enterobacterales bacterium]